jgi:endonuclease-3 related protein
MARSRETAEEQIRRWFHALYSAWGKQHWWPAQSRWEVIVGAFLTQNTAWTNVEHAMRNLRRARALSVSAIRRMPLRELEQLVRPAGYFRQKAQRLKAFVAWLDRNYGGSLDRMFARPTPQLREELLALNGIGPETADSILLYAGHHASFVVDAYTRRVLHRHGVLPATADYEEIRALFERAVAGEPLPPFVDGLIVNVGKYHCRKPFPLCEGCPLKPFLPEKGPFDLTKKLTAETRRRGVGPNGGRKRESRSLRVAKKRH